MIKFIIPAIVVFLIVIFWEKICNKIYEKFKIKLNYIVIVIIVLILALIFTLLYFWFLMRNLNLKNTKLTRTDGVFTLKNINTTLGFVRFNKIGEVEYIFVNPIFRKNGIAKRLLKLVKDETGKKLVFQQPISPLGKKLLKSVEKWT